MNFNCLVVTEISCLIILGLFFCCPGLGKTMFPRMEGLVRTASLLYFRVFKHQTVDYFNQAISIFWNTPVKAPALFFFSENDALCDYKSLEKMVDFWRNQGLSVESKKWKESLHAGHLRIHPQEYLSTLENFVLSLNMVPLKAKMWMAIAFLKHQKLPEVPTFVT